MSLKLSRGRHKAPLLASFVVAGTMLYEPDFNVSQAQATDLKGSFANGYSDDPANQVDVELVLAVDISKSIDLDEQKVQRDGYVEALTSTEFLNAIKKGSTERIAVIYMEWGGADEHFIVADWAVIQDKKSAENFASKIAEAPFRHMKRTSIASALNKSFELVQGNKYRGLRHVIDISGDGPNNQGGSLKKIRDKIIKHNIKQDLIFEPQITINGLPLMMKSKDNAWNVMLKLDHYYEDCVILGPNSFSIPVRSKETFAEAIRNKLVREIAVLDPFNQETETDFTYLYYNDKEPYEIQNTGGIRFGTDQTKRKPLNCATYEQ